MILTRAKELCVTILYHRLRYGLFSLATESRILGGSLGSGMVAVSDGCSCGLREQRLARMPTSLYAWCESSTTVF